MHMPPMDMENVSNDAFLVNGKRQEAFNFRLGAVSVLNQ